MPELRAMSAAPDTRLLDAPRRAALANPQEADPTQADVLRNLAFEAQLAHEEAGGLVGSRLGQRAACLNWIAADAEYQRWLGGGQRVPEAQLVQAEQDVLRQFRLLLS